MQIRRIYIFVILFIAVTQLVAAINVSTDSVWGLIRVSAAHVRTEPRHSAEMSTQAIMGTPIRILSKDSGWSKVELPDGYIGYIINNSIAFKSESQIKKWRSANRMIVKTYSEIKAYQDSIGNDLRGCVTDLINGNIVEGLYSNAEKRLKVSLPDGRVAWVDSQDVTDIKEWANQSFDADKILDIAYSMMGTPYLWGGTSTKGVDCSGLVKVAYFANGIITLRDAYQQATVGNVTYDYHPGDLLFFWNQSKTRINHVAIYEKDGYYIQSAGRVMRSHLSPTHRDYYNNNFKECRTYRGIGNTEGFVRASCHPWYF